MQSARNSKSDLTVIGGTYKEQCAFPAFDEVYGSGLRGACALATSGAKVTFRTALHSSLRPLAEMKSAIYGFTIDAVEGAHAHCFSYLHPLSGGHLSPPAATDQPTISTSATRMLIYGMVDSRLSVTGRDVVYDPQSPGDPRHFSDFGTASHRLGLVLNREEARVLTGIDDPRRSARALKRSDAASVVVVKDGPRGAVVFADGKFTDIPVFVGKQTFLIGSGDVFSAIFAKKWLLDGRAAAEAARAASLATAIWCDTQTFPLPKATADYHRVLPRTRRRPLVYLAGPFFNIPQLWWVTQVREILRAFGAEVFSPYHDVGLARHSTATVAKEDLAGLARADVVFALIDGHDPGTIFEIGYARKKGIPVICFRSEPRTVHHETMLSGSDCRIFSDLGSAIYHALWSNHTKR
jgi:nucleoside 2-deoxyribosyltransferase